ncbi:hypothetical protein F0U61_15820 [Archangium violaceum]|nr:hypothetical protein F0U61_15820 [Archangium violaceum]
MRHWLRGAAGVILATSLSLTGCNEPLEKDERSPEPAPQPLKEVGDWEPGLLAQCPIITDGSSEAECGTLESFDLSACDAESFEALDTQGSFTLHVVSNDDPDNINETSTLKFLSNGRVAYGTTLMKETRVDSRTFYLSTASTLQDGRKVRNTLVGCKAQGPNRVTGCSVTCLGGKPTYQLTFEAEKVVRRPGESESSGLSLIGEARVTHGDAVDVYVTRGHAYVVAITHITGPGGLFVYDLSDRTSPRLVKSITFPGDSYWNGVWAKDDALYVASAAKGVIVFDISNPADPQFLHSLPGNGAINVHTVFVDGNRLYAMSPSPGTETLIFDVTNAKQPVLLNRYQVPGVDPSIATFPHDAFAQGDRLYLNHWRFGFLILDVSDPTNVVKLGEYTYPRATSHTNRVGRFGDRVIAFEGGEDWGAHLRVLDITNPAQVKLIGEYRLRPGASIHNMELAGDRLYLAHYQDGVRVLDVSRPEHPREVAYYNTWRETDPYRGLSFFDGAIGIRRPGDGYLYAIDLSRGLLIFPEP